MSEREMTPEERLAYLTAEDGAIEEAPTSGDLGDDDTGVLADMSDMDDLVDIGGEA